MNEWRRTLLPRLLVLLLALTLRVENSRALLVRVLPGARPGQGGIVRDVRQEDVTMMSRTAALRAALAVCLILKTDMKATPIEPPEARCWARTKLCIVDRNSCAH